MVESAPPRQSVVRLFAREFFLIFSRAQKYWWETHLLDPLLKSTPSKLNGF